MKAASCKPAILVTASGRQRGRRAYAAVLQCSLPATAAWHEARMSLFSSRSMGSLRPNSWPAKAISLGSQADC